MGQTNSSPASGNAGIGVLAPTDLLEINSGAVRKGITIKGDGTSGVFNDIVFTMNTKNVLDMSDKSSPSFRNKN